MTFGRLKVVGLAAAIALVAPLISYAQANSFEPVPRGTYTPYDGNSKSNPANVYNRDEDLATPPASAPSFGPWQVIDGRKVRFVSRLVRAGIFQGRQGYNLSFAGLEDDKGKVILPVVFKDVRILPGRVYVRSYLGNQAYDLYDLKTGKRTPVPGLSRILQHTVRNAPIEGAVLEYTLQDTEVTLPVAMRFDEDAAPGAPPIPKKKMVPFGRIEVIGPDGAVIMTYAGLAPVMMFTQEPLYGSDVPRKSPGYIQQAQGFWVMGLVTQTGDVAMQALDRDFLPVGKVFPWAVDAVGLDYVAPAPDVPDAWVKVTPEGLSAPEGGLAYRPIGDGNMSEAVALAKAYEGDGHHYVQGSKPLRWLVAYPAPDGGVFWGYMDPQLKQASGPLWREVRHLQTETLKDGTATPVGATVAVKTMDGKWRVMAKTFPELRPGEYADLGALIAGREGEVLAWKESQRKQAAARAATEQASVAAQIEDKRQRWRRLWQLGHWQEIRILAEAWGDEFFLEYMDSHPTPTVKEMEQAVGMSFGPQRQRFEKKLAEAKEREKEFARLRIQYQIEARIEQVEREKEARLFRPDFSEYKPTIPSVTSQGLVDYNARVNRENCAVADKGGLRSCFR